MPAQTKLPAESPIKKRRMTLFMFRIVIEYIYDEINERYRKSGQRLAPVDIVTGWAIEHNPELARKINEEYQKAA